GAIGHLAEQCSAESRLCFNCKQPGHESAACPNPRTADAKQCYQCSGIGHLAVDCPSVKVGGQGFQSGGQKCYTCGRMGHISRTCNQAGNNYHAPRSNYSKPRLAPGQVIQCYKCQGMNHYARLENSIYPFLTRSSTHSLGFDSRSCRDCMATFTANVNSGFNHRPKTCYRCQSAGHIARDCPQAESAGEVIAT
ncbi:hypothetical protein DFH28DRAFT_886597, partial [Melampsora americana]